MLEVHAVSHPEFGGPGAGAGDERRTQIQPVAADAARVGPGAQHLAGTTREVEDLLARLQQQCLTELRQLPCGQGVMDAVGAFPDDERPR